MVFRDRIDAGRQLAFRLLHYKGKDVVVLGIPRGGVIVAAEVASQLGAPLDVIIPRKIGAPFNPELAVGAVAPDGTVIYDEDLLERCRIEKSSLQKEIAQEIEEIRERLRLYRGERHPLDCAGKTVIVIDDGIATGFTVQAALRSLRRENPEQLVLAVPVAPRDTLERLQQEVDELICLVTPEMFYAVGQFYDDFHQTTHEEVIAALAYNRGTSNQK